MDTVVVLGGSVAGLIAARIVASRARNVIVVESDAIARPAAERQRVPHAEHLHTLVLGGLEQLARLFPGLPDEARAAGASLCTSENVAFYGNGERNPPLAPGQALLAVSRSLLEELLRSRVVAMPGVQVFHGRADKIEIDRGVVVAAHVRRHTGESLRVRADLVVDAMGRSSRMSDWLEAAGHERPPLERVPSHARYATALFARDEDHPPLAAATARFTPSFESAGLAQAVVNAIDGKRWMVMLCGYGKNTPGTTEKDLRDRCAALPEVFARASRGPLLGPIRTFHLAENRRRRWDRLPDAPARLVSVGDAVASFNPAFGQGMTSAALQGAALEVFLARDPDLDRPAADFFSMQKVVVDAAWMVSAAADAERLGDPVTPPSWRVRARRRWFGRVKRAALSDSTVSAQLNAVSFLRAHPYTLTRPVIVARTLRASCTVASSRSRFRRFQCGRR